MMKNKKGKRSQPSPSDNGPQHSYISVLSALLHRRKLNLISDVVHC